MELCDQSKNLLLSIGQCEQGAGTDEVHSKVVGHERVRDVRRVSPESLDLVHTCQIDLMVQCESRGGKDECESLDSSEFIPPR